MSQEQIKRLDELLNSRYSVRGFKPDLVPQETLEAIFTSAQRYPSNCNIQPCKTYVASGALRDQLSEALIKHIFAGIPPAPDFLYFDKFEGEHRDRRYACAMALYGAMGVERSDREGRQKASLRNYEFFDAPHVAFICMPKTYESVNIIDAGIYLQTLMLVMKAHGIGSCAQGALTFYPEPVKELLGIDEDLGIIVGLSFGYADMSVPANDTRTERALLDEVVTFLS